MSGRAAVLATLALFVLLGGTASAVPPPPLDLEVQGGEAAWHPKRAFRIAWRNPPPSGGWPIVAVHYRVRDPAGAVAIGATRLGWPATTIEWLEVPDVPGTYTVEVWLEDATGEEGAPVSAKLRFDDRRPGQVEPVTAPAWIGRAAFPLSVHIGHPNGAPPASGIRGYAVSVAPPPGTDPCAAIDRCTDVETDLRGGIGGDSYAIAALPEGISYLHAVAVSGSGMASAAPGRTVLRVDKTSPVTRLDGAPAGWTNHPVRLTVTAADDGSGMAAGGGGPPPFTAIAIDGRPPATSPGASVSAVVIGEGVHRVAHYARDLAGNVDDGRSNPAPAIALVRIDREPPHVSFVNSQDPSDPELIRARIGDSTSGPDLGKGGIGVRRVGSGDRFEPLPAGRTGDGELSARWDSDAYAPGEYEFRAVGYDTAGNSAGTTLRASGAAMVLSNPLKATTALRTTFRDEVLRRTVPHGRGLLLGGHLTSVAGAPLSRMQVRIVERFAAAAAAPVRVSTVTTGPDGAYAIRLAPGPSREITAIFDGTPTLSRSTSRPVRLGVRSGVRLRVSSARARIGGPPLVFRGQVAADPGTIPVGGKAVQLQFRLPGLRWSEFRTVQTDARGRFRYAYRFSDDDSRGARFQFRAYAPAQAGWPYEPAGSLPVVVRGG
ncbi:MAG TPA: hypothetical protein VNP96_05365 [Solirubrobacterales bacterium]|nr:hypothetical protein [Solirubrobacterales bacterium]